MPVRLTRFLLLPVALLALPGCFWGDVDGGVTFRVTDRNVDQYLGLLYPTSRQAEWTEMFKDRPNLCPDGPGCDSDELERSGDLELFLRYDSSRVRGLMTQKGDLQVTSHLDVGAAYKQLMDESYSDWAGLIDEDKLRGVTGGGCASDIDPADRTGVGRCIHDEVQANEGVYKSLSEDIRLVILINLPGEDDVRSVQCQDRPREFTSTDWSLPRTMLVNYDATGPVDAGNDQTRYGDDEDEPLQQCDIEVFSQLTFASETFAADQFGQADDADETIEDARDATESPLVGSVVLEELVLPGEGGQAHAKGRYSLEFTASRFSERDGSVALEGSFDVRLRTDPEQVEDPDREIDLDPSAEEE